MGLFLACCLLITAIQLVTDPITCDVKVCIMFTKIVYILCFREFLVVFLMPSAGLMQPSLYLTDRFNKCGFKHMTNVLLVLQRWSNHLSGCWTTER